MGSGVRSWRPIIVQNNYQNVLTKVHKMALKILLHSSQKNNTSRLSSLPACLSFLLSASLSFHVHKKIYGPDMCHKITWIYQQPLSECMCQKVFFLFFSVSVGRLCPFLSITLIILRKLENWQRQHKQQTINNVAYRTLVDYLNLFVDNQDRHQALPFRRELSKKDIQDDDGDDCCC